MRDLTHEGPHVLSAAPSAHLALRDAKPSGHGDHRVHDRPARLRVSDLLRILQHARLCECSGACRRKWLEGVVRRARAGAARDPLPAAPLSQPNANRPTPSCPRQPSKARPAAMLHTRPMAAMPPLRRLGGCKPATLQQRAPKQQRAPPCPGHPPALTTSSSAMYAAVSLTLAMAVLRSG